MEILISRRVFVSSLAGACLVAFLVGRIARIRLIQATESRLINLYNEKIRSIALLAIEDYHNDDERYLMNKKIMTLPHPVMKKGKPVPRSTYTSKNFDTTLSATTHSRWVVTQSGEHQCVNLPNHPECSGTTSNEQISSLLLDKPVRDDYEEEHLPSGQHLLIDIEDVDSHFLNSEERLASAMLELVNECDLTLLSYQ
jgi:hypothetical protein